MLVVVNVSCRKCNIIVAISVSVVVAVTAACGVVVVVVAIVMMIMEKIMAGQQRRPGSGESL